MRGAIATVIKISSMDGGIICSATWKEARVAVRAIDPPREKQKKRAAEILVVLPVSTRKNNVFTYPTPQSRVSRGKQMLRTEGCVTVFWWRPLLRHTKTRHGAWDGRVARAPFYASVKNIRAREVSRQSNFKRQAPHLTFRCGETLGWFSVTGRCGSSVPYQKFASPQYSLSFT